MPSATEPSSTLVRIRHASVYRGFPKSLCTSINEVIRHGIPDDTVLQDGDIINIDIAAKERGRLSFARWANLQLYYTMLENLISPDLFIGGGGVSKSHAEFLPLLKLRTPIVPAALRNNAGILGAAALAAEAAPANSTTEQ